MKNIVLSIVVVAALMAAGIGGTLADFSDSEEEVGDVLQAGSLDLKVNQQDEPVLPFTIRTMIPDKWYDVTKTVSNVGTIDGWLYLHIKNVVCTETNDKDLNGDGRITAPEDNPEPENIAQFGNGRFGQKEVPGVGERCDMEKHIAVEIRYDGVLVDLSAYDKNGDGEIKLDELMCEQIPLPQLVACGEEHEVNFSFLLQDVDEAYYGLDIFDETDPHEVKWNWWPTNAYQGDTVTFDILFELLQTDYEPPQN
jgi:predicted ribosomally synthesized peptide with SipW-like signal peptide